jgi:hypothetical protein
MFKRIFWLALALGAGWIVWRWFQQRAADFDTSAAPRLPLEPSPSVARAPMAPVAPAIPLERPAVAPAHTPATPAANDVAVAENVEATPVVEVVEVAESVEAAAVAAVAENVEAAQAIESAEVAAPVEAAQAAAAAPENALDAVVGYCVRCKTKRTISDAHEDITESGRRAARGLCPVCGAKMFTFLPTD